MSEATRACRECGAVLPPPPNPKNPVYLCSDACRRERKNRVRRATRFEITCVVCGTPVRTADGQQRYCSVDCRRLRRRGDRRERQCVGCRQAFLPAREGQVYCAARCRRFEHYRQNTDRYISQARERKERVRRVVVESFTSLEIFERDGWMCGICGDRVDASLKAPDLMRKSLDHVIPIAKGGMHSRVNTQLAHLLCNLVKNDSMPAERGELNALEAESPQRGPNPRV